MVPTLTLMGVSEKKPELGKGVFIAPNAAVMGNVKIGDRASIWYGSVIRGGTCDVEDRDHDWFHAGDVNGVKIGDRTNIQDNVIVHVAKNALPPATPKPTIIGSNVTVGASLF